ncbi:MAG: galactose oxidase-like domain-containing protein [Anaerolineales bacterium]
MVSLPIVPVHAIMQPDGQILIFDQANGGNSARVWDPITNAIVSAPNITTNLFCAGHSTLADGRFLIIGGHLDPNYFGLPNTNIFDPFTRTWTRVADMAFPRWYPTSTTLPDGRVLALSGWITTAQLANTPEVYDAATNTWTALTAATRENPMYSFMFVLPDGTVFNAGPDVATRRLNVNTQSWTDIGSSFITAHSAVMYRPGRIMKSGTFGDPDNSVGTVHGRTVVVDLNQPAPAWREVAPMASPRAYHTLVLLPDGTVLVSGGERDASGQDTSQAVTTTELWNPETETWTTLASQQRARLYHSTAWLLPDGRVVSAGGYFPPYEERNAQIFSPPYLFKGPRPTISSAPTTAGYGQTLNVATNDAATIASVALIRSPAVTHGIDMNQRYVPLNFSVVGNGLQVVTPANANLAPPGYYMLFIVNSSGVPSVARFVRLDPAAPPPATPTPTPTLTSVNTPTPSK